MGLNNTQQCYLQKMGIDIYVPRQDHAADVVAAIGQVHTPVDTGIDRPEWESLRKQVAACTKCELHKGRIQTVFGVGNVRAEWMIIGEAPGAEEDKQGEPFVGRAGKLLNSMLRAIGLQREQVFIANILKCLRYNALVQLEDGSWERIGRLVR